MASSMVSRLAGMAIHQHVSNDHGEVVLGRSSHASRSLSERMRWRDDRGMTAASPGPVPCLEECRRSSVATAGDVVPEHDAGHLPSAWRPEPNSSWVEMSSHVILSAGITTA